MSKQGVWLATALAALALAIGVFIWRQVAQQAGPANLERQRLLLAERAAQFGAAPLPDPPLQDAALVALGQVLFFEKALSGNRDVSCATCHDAQFGLGDGLPLSIGPGGQGVGPQRVAGDGRPPVARNAPSLFNVGSPLLQSLFWDGRVEAAAAGGYHTPAGAFLPAGLQSLLAAQAMFPVTFRDEMRGGWYQTAGYSVQPGAMAAAGAPGGWHDVDVFGNVNELAAIANDQSQLSEIWQALMGRLQAEAHIVARFQAAYPHLEPEAWRFEQAANALAAYQTEAFALTDTPWDRFLAGELQALDGEAVAGGLLFFGEAGCAGCHNGPLLSDGGYHNIGAPQLGPGTDDDAPLDYGRQRVSGEPADRFAFRTPALRQTALTGPWLHNGAYETLEEVVWHHLHAERALRRYDGGRLPPALRATVQNAPVTIEAILQTLDPLLRQERHLSQRQVRQLVAFLHSLGQQLPAAAVPRE